VLEQFREWLDQAHAQSTRSDDHWNEDSSPAQAVGLVQWVEELTALRHELKLLTKSLRAKEEKDDGALQRFQLAIERFESSGIERQAQVDKACQPLIETLIDLDEALLRGRQVIQKARRRLLEEFAGELNEARERFEAIYRLQPWWRRVLCRPWHAAIQDLYLQRALEAPRRIFDSLLEGYDLVGARLERTMKQESVLRMETVGRPVDPNSMTVLEVVEDPGRPPGTVLEEVRSGYYWKGRILRFAEVKAITGG
jgi:molecular chaperone GrpE